MEENNKEAHTLVPEIKSKSENKRWKIFAAFIVVLIIVTAGLFGGVAILHSHYEGRVLPKTFVGHIDLGGLTKEEALTSLETWQDKWWSSQMQYQIQDEQKHVLADLSFYPIIVIDEGEGNSSEFIWYDLAAMVDQAYEIGQAKPLYQQIVRELGLGNQINLQAMVQVDDIQLREVLALELATYETLPQNAQFEWKNSSSDPVIVSEQHGNVFDYDKAIADTRELLVSMEIGSIIINRSAAVPLIDATQAQELIDGVEAVKESFPLTLVYSDPRIGFDREWKLTWANAYPSIQPISENGNAKVGLTSEIESFWERVESIINVEADDARFEINEETKKVEQFQPSRPGYSLDRENTLLAMNQFFGQEDSSTVGAVVISKDPVIATSDVNDLGITELLGVGYSSFAGSPRNRVHNIEVGVNKLNGILIQPDEEFSLLAALRPFTISGGYLPELVIKGDKIIPEIGGGLCQIGTTTFRAAMKSGLNISQRRNHSLAISYYNDPRNGNPGTDATIYDSSPDFRFINDTGNYILLKTEMNKSNGDLSFSFWGTSDGRKADYTEPIVHRWIGTGPTKYIETTDLAPGQKKCQGGHAGATTSFTYNVDYEEGQDHEQVFSSSYRALPTICLVGVDPDAPVEGEDVAEEVADIATQPEPETTQEEVVS